MDLHYECPNADFSLTPEIVDGEQKMYKKIQQLYSPKKQTCNWVTSLPQKQRPDLKYLQKFFPQRSHMNNQLKKQQLIFPKESQTITPKNPFSATQDNFRKQEENDPIIDKIIQKARSKRATTAFQYSRPPQAKLNVQYMGIQNNQFGLYSYEQDLQTRQNQKTKHYQDHSVEELYEKYKSNLQDLQRSSLEEKKSSENIKKFEQSLKNYDSLMNRLKHMNQQSKTLKLKQQQNNNNMQLDQSNKNSDISRLTYKTISINQNVSFKDACEQNNSLLENQFSIKTTKSLKERKSQSINSNITPKNNENTINIIENSQEQNNINNSINSDNLQPKLIFSTPNNQVYKQNIQNQGNYFVNKYALPKGLQPIKLTKQKQQQYKIITDPETHFHQQKLLTSLKIRSISCKHQTNKQSNQQKSKIKSQYFRKNLNS